MKEAVKKAKPKPPWQKPRPKTGASTKLSEEDKAAARARAARNGRPYPNLIDNMWAAARAKRRKRDGA